MDRVKEIMQEAESQNKKISLQDAFEMSVDDCDNKESVTTSDLYDNFYRTLNEIKLKMNSKENKNKIFESSASSKGKYLILMILAIFILITVRPIIEYGEVETLPFALLFPRNRIYYINRKSYRFNKNT